MKSKILILGGIIMLLFIGSNVLVESAHAGEYHPTTRGQFEGPKSGPFGGGLFLGAIAIIGINIVMITRSRNSNSHRIKWFVLFIGLSLLLIFSVFNSVGMFDDIWIP